MAVAASNSNRRDEVVAELAHTLADAPARMPAPRSDPALAKLRQVGTEPWLDTGNLDEARSLWRAELTALTTNNSLANQVVQSGLMDATIREAARRIRAEAPEVPADDLVLDLVFVVNCHIALRLAGAFGARVSVELHPGVARDVEQTVRYARRYHAVSPDRFIVKIPLTPEGYCAVARVRAEGIPVNFTLGFSARQNYLAALLAGPDYVNVFLGRLNAVVADNKLGDGKFVGEKVALASQAAVRELREARPGVPTRQIAASMRNADQMLALAGVDVFTIPPKVLAEFYARGPSPDAIRSRREEQYEVKLGNDTDKGGVEVLWTIDDAFRAFADELATRGGANLSGADLRRADRDHGTKLFADFDEAGRAAIREKGKIPDVARWRGRAALDDLMTEAALQSFHTDQAAFDAYVRKLIEAA
ncbi:putative transaldolase [Aquisphaera giovannonii]|uniref:Putative transaldolase n=1 Tax=Aquisphaera giovannonii TaxID=406548 RepID=A0A5B9VUH8_9BACT|nr:transaldolase family protein [Aquisphaera giovannonii]QEH31744.1 putative transaldolase [Aquisphaera giovannonii]